MQILKVQYIIVYMLLLREHSNNLLQHWFECALCALHFYLKTGFGQLGKLKLKLFNDESYSIVLAALRCGHEFPEERTTPSI